MTTLINEFLETIPDSSSDAWNESRWKHWARQGNKAKGKTGEDYIALLLSRKGYKNLFVGGGCKDYDLHFNIGKIEVKTSFAQQKDGVIIQDMFKWQHIGLEKDWDYIAFIGVNPEAYLCRSRRSWRTDDEQHFILWFTKKEIKEFIDRGLITPQAGGQGSGNDDFWTSNSFLKIINYGKEYRNIPWQHE